MGPRRLSRVPRTTIRTFNAQLRRRVPQRPLLDLRHLPWPSPWMHRLGTLYPRPKTGTYDDACSGFTRVADRTVASALLRTRPLDHARGHRYQGPRRLPGPDSHRQAIPNLSLLRHIGSFPHDAGAVSAHVGSAGGFRDRAARAGPTVRGLPPAAASNRACGSLAHGSPTSFTGWHTRSGPRPSPARDIAAGDLS